jgi:putative SOS response-associated peptidase YedK
MKEGNMCGRYTITSNAEQLAARFGAAPPDAAAGEATAQALEPRFNAAPTQTLPVILNQAPDEIQLLRWGLVPRWAKDASGAAKMINVRAETVEEKPSFRDAVRRRRCLVLADSFYEWRHTPEGKVPMRIMLASGQPFAFAGIWELWRDPKGELLRSFAIITTTPNELVAPIHNRMPAILLPEHERLWLDDNPDAAPWRDVLGSYPADAMVAYPVSRLVNSPANDTPAVIAAA